VSGNRPGDYRGRPERRNEEDDVGVLDGKVAVVTGAGRGIGRGEALLLASEGASVVVNDLGTAGDGGGHDDTPAQQVVNEIEAAGGKAIANYEDVTNWDGAKRLIDQAVEHFGSMDILVNNAGILRDKMSFNMDEDDFDGVIRVHLKGHFAPTRWAAVRWRELAKAGAETSGRIINTSSEAGMYGNVGQANYSAAKGGIYSMTLSLARELKRYNVTVNAIAPRARTRMTENLGGSFSEAPPADGFDELHPDNVAPVVGFLASDAAADVSGQLFMVTGGRVHVMAPYEPQGSVRRDRRWTVGELIEAKAELFGDRSSKIPRFGFGE
jgi:NAD(P)-dependent dehydrogenase (short-subunit alcohol dehydrogenase family)